MSSLNWKHADDHVSVGSVEQARRNLILQKWWQEIERIERRYFIAMRVSRNMRRRYRLSEEKVNA